MSLAFENKESKEVLFLCDFCCVRNLLAPCTFLEGLRLSMKYNIIDTQ